MLLAAIALLPPGTGRLFGYLGLSSLNVPVYLGVLLSERALRHLAVAAPAPGVAVSARSCSRRSS